jgi:DNA integrity scanning protein DisA with diadenylate cyclase activity
MKSLKLNSGVLFFGGPLDIFRYIVDILLITFILYGLLRILRETRAWQLLKGLLLIFLMTIICSLLGLEMVSFIINNVLYIVALAFVVIFQPELRRALETVGLKSFSSISVAFSTEDQDPQHILTRMIDETVSACVKMSKSFTGALIIFERTSKLSELTLQKMR